ncbi:MAG: hypothetical protein K8T20_06345 [Planctomycetes bacterium]|nr:hypothetical protein [Planctomycetota bacterium]
MRLAPTLAFAVTAALAATPAFAGDPVWQFKPGQTFTWECTTEFHYLQQGMTIARGGNGGREGGTTEDPQWETLTLKATVLAVGDDGAARLEFAVAAMHVETRFDSSGDHADWDSTKSKETDIVAFKRYQAMLGHKFQAIVNLDGTLRDIKNAEWPTIDTTGMKPTKKNERDERAASATHDPTDPHVWLTLIFGTTPEGKAEYTKTLQLPQDEKLTFKADNSETVGKYLCSLVQVKSQDKERAVKPEDLLVKSGSGGGGVGDYAIALCKAAQKKGSIWFSRQAGCLVKVEITGATELADARVMTRTHFKWGVELKERGFTALTPGAGNTPENPEPTPSK